MKTYLVTEWHPNQECSCGVIYPIPQEIKDGLKGYVVFSEEDYPVGILFTYKGMQFVKPGDLIRQGAIGYEVIHVDRNLC